MMDNNHKEQTLKTRGKQLWFSLSDIAAIHSLPQPKTLLCLVDVPPARAATKARTTAQLNDLKDDTECEVQGLDRCG
jgi:hypothetical protein